MKKSKKVVREKYGKITSEQSSCCQPTISCCCSDAASNIRKFISYSNDDLIAVPESDIVRLGYGNPTALALLKDGEIVIKSSAQALGSIAFRSYKRSTIQVKLSVWI